MKTLSFPVENESDGQEIAVESSINYLKMIVDKKNNLKYFHDKTSIVICKMYRYSFYHPFCLQHKIFDTYRP